MCGQKRWLDWFMVSSESWEILCCLTQDYFNLANPVMVVLIPFTIEKNAIMFRDGPQTPHRNNSLCWELYFNKWVTGMDFFLLSCFIQMLDMVTCTSILQLPLGGTFANPGLLKSGASRWHILDRRSWGKCPAGGWLISESTSQSTMGRKLT